METENFDFQRTVTFAPQSGPASTDVEVFTDFEPVTGILFGNKAVAFSPTNNGGYTFKVPIGVGTSKITAKSLAVSATSETFFVVTAGPVNTGNPKITSFNPTSGPGGTTVQVFGENLGTVTEATLAGMPCQRLFVSATRVDIKLPPMPFSGRITLAAAEGTATSPTDFIVTTVPAPAGPRIDGFTPTSGLPPIDITITGAGFATASQVFIGGRSIGFDTLSDSTILARIPQDAMSGLISVANAGGTTSSMQPFSVTNAPTGPSISSFSPSAATVGDEVVVRGMRLANPISIAINGRPQQRISETETEIRFRVVSGTTSGRIVVTTSAGTAISQAILTVQTSLAAFLTAAVPRRAKVGDIVTLLGGNLSGTTRALVGGQQAMIQNIMDSQVVITIPNLQPGFYAIALETSRGSALLGDSFEVFAETVSIVETEVMIAPTQPINEPDPLLDNDDRADFDPQDSQASLSLMAGDRFTFRLFAKRLDMLQDTVTVRLLPAPPPFVTINFPPTVEANVGFDVEIVTQPKAEPANIPFSFFGESSRNPGALYRPFTLSFTIKPPLIFELPSKVVVLRQGSVKFRFDVIRRRYTGTYDFSFPNAESKGIQVTKVLIGNTPVNPNSLATKDTWEVTFKATAQSGNGLTDLTFSATVPDASFKAPASLKVNVVDPRFGIDGEAQKIIVPNGMVEFDYSFLPGEFRGRLLVVHEFFSVNPQNRSNIIVGTPITHDVTSAELVRGTVTIQATPSAVEDDVFINLLLTTELNEEVGIAAIALAVRPKPITLVSELPDFSIFRDVKALVKLSIVRAPNFSDEFEIIVIRQGVNLNTLINGGGKVGTTIFSKTLNVTPGNIYTEGDTEIEVVARPIGSQTNLSDPVIIPVYRRLKETLLMWNKAIFMVPNKTFVESAELSFSNFLMQKIDGLIGTRERLSVKIKLVNARGVKVTTFTFRRPGNSTAATELATELTNAIRAFAFTIDAKSNPSNQPAAFTLRASVELLGAASFSLNYDFEVPFTYLGQLPPTGVVAPTR